MMPPVKFNHRNIFVSLFIIGLLVVAIRPVVAQTDGANWVKVTDAASWSPRLDLQTFTYNDRLWVYEGSTVPHTVDYDPYWENRESVDTVYYGKELWNTLDGIQWTKVTPKGGSFPWVEENLPVFIVVFNHQLWAIPKINDPWHGYGAKGSWISNDGYEWTLVSSSFPWERIFTLTVCNGRLFACDAFSQWESTDGQLWVDAKWAGDHYMDRILTYNMWSFHNKLYCDDPFLTEEHRPRLVVYDDLSATEIMYDEYWSWCESGAPVRYKVAEWNDQLWAVGMDATRSCWSKRSWPENPRSVWNSVDGTTWSLVTTAAAWPSRIRAGFVPFHGRLYYFGGASVDAAGNVTGLLNDVWATAIPDGSPQLYPIPDLETHFGDPFTGPAPALVKGSSPLMWTLLQGPSGMTIDAGTGVVHWPNPPLSDQPSTVTIRAANSLGQADVTWRLRVTAYVPEMKVPELTSSTTLTVRWIATDNPDHVQVQLAEAADFSAPLAEATVNAGDQAYTFTGLEDNHRYYIRMRSLFGSQQGNWSDPAAVICDLVAPKGSVSPVDRSLVAPYRIGLDLSAISDPGTLASGLAQMRFQQGVDDWSAWESFVAAKNLPTQKTGGDMAVRVQVSDKAGNVADFSTTVTLPAQWAIYVDKENTAGPWIGTAEHPLKQINDAMAAASVGALIYVQPSSGSFDFTVIDKDVTLRSSGGATIKGMRIEPGVSAACMVEGFTISGGSSGIYGSHSKATIQNNIISRNGAVAYWGGGYWLPGGPFGPIWVDQPVTRVWGHGGGLYECDGLIQNNIIAYNSLASSLPGDSSNATWEISGTALYDCDGTIRNNTIYGNTGMNNTYNQIDQCNGTIVNNIIANEQPQNPVSNSTLPRYCCIPGWTGGGEGNITTDPKFSDLYHFYLLPSSPCINAGAPESDLAKDFIGQQRGLGRQCDIGAYEFNYVLLFDEYNSVDSEAWAAYE